MPCKDQMRGVVQHVCTFVIAYHIKEAFKGGPVMQVFTRMNFIGQIYATTVEMIKNWQPSTAQFFKRLFHQPRRALRPRVEIRPG